MIMLGVYALQAGSGPYGSHPKPPSSCLPRGHEHVADISMKYGADLLLYICIDRILIR